MTKLFSFKAKPRMNEFMKRHLEFNGFFALRLKMTNRQFLKKSHYKIQARL
ncbi:hypothetical protein [Campylobacter troglodytis]|uniref:hypothetical protein n=1 Tax=Campylobacter troglodytis TaxID=654363 RepID=UPI00163C5DDF|nr:hypothetical protein [Campylobacter troglodytis]